MLVFSSQFEPNLRQIDFAAAPLNSHSYVLVPDVRAQSLLFKAISSTFRDRQKEILAIKKNESKITQKDSQLSNNGTSNNKGDGNTKAERCEW